MTPEQRSTISAKSGAKRPVRRAGRSAKADAVPEMPGSDRRAAFEERIGHRFTNESLLFEALTHASVDPVAGKSGLRVNERLEFLGDRVLGLMAAEALLAAYPEAPEGDLAPRLNALVRKETCAEVALECGLDGMIVLAAAEKSSGGAAKPAILGDACEALIAALYLDGGMDVARAFFDCFWGDRLQALDVVPRDAKTRLQEWVQGRSKETPRYRVTERRGPDHAPEFDVEVSVPNLASAQGTGPSKRAAEQAAAEAMLLREGVEGAKA